MFMKLFVISLLSVVEGRFMFRGPIWNLWSQFLSNLLIKCWKASMKQAQGWEMNLFLLQVNTALHLIHKSLLFIIHQKKKTFKQHIITHDIVFWKIFHFSYSKTEIEFLLFSFRFTYKNVTFSHDLDLDDANIYHSVTSYWRRSKKY